MNIYVINEYDEYLYQWYDSIPFLRSAEKHLPPLTFRSVTRAAIGALGRVLNIAQHKLISEGFSVPPRGRGGTDGGRGLPPIGNNSPHFLLHFSHGPKLALNKWIISPFRDVQARPSLQNKFFVICCFPKSKVLCTCQHNINTLIPMKQRAKVFSSILTSGVSKLAGQLKLVLWEGQMTVFSHPPPPDQFASFQSRSKACPYHHAFGRCPSLVWLWGGQK